MSAKKPASQESRNLAPLTPPLSSPADHSSAPGTHPSISSASENPESDSSGEDTFVLLAKRLTKSLPPFAICLGLVLVLAFLLRSPRTDYGLPYVYWWDEPEIMQPVQQIMRHNDYGLVRSHRIGYGALNHYLHTGWAAKSYLSGLGQGLIPERIWGIVGERETGYYWKMTDPTIWQGARQLSAYLGCFAVLFTFLAAYRLGGLAVAFPAGLYLAIHPEAIGMTTNVSPDAPALACIAALLLCSAVVLKSGHLWAYTLCGLLAALAAGFKINYAIGLILPAVAHVGGALTRGDRIFTAKLGLFTAVFLPTMILTQIDALRFPLHWITTYGEEFSAHALVSPGILDMLAASFKTLLVFSAADDFGGWNYTKDLITKFRFSGLPVTVVLLLGIWHMGRRAPATTLVLILVLPLVLLLTVVQNAGFVFSRYVLPATPMLGVVVGFGVLGISNLLRKREGFLRNDRGHSVLVLAALVMLPLSLNMGWQTFKMARYTDPRVKMERYILDKYPEGTTIGIAADLRWMGSPAFNKKFRTRVITTSQWIGNPDMTSGVQLLVLPHQVDFSFLKLPFSKPAEQVNRALATLTPIQEFFPEETKVPSPVIFGRPPKKNSVKLVENMPQLLQRPAYIQMDAVQGWAFLGVGQAYGPIAYGDGYKGLQPGRETRGQVLVTKPMRSLVVSAYGTAPIQQSTMPGINVELWTLDRPSTAPLLKRDVWLSRSQARLSDYTISAEVPPGRYQFRLRGSDPDGRVIMLAGIRFE
jgi:hypothetical protein